MNQSFRRLAGIVALLSAMVPMAARAELPVSQPEVVAMYPHDRTAFTEGLFFRDGALYESTGQEGQSTIRKVDLASGKVLASVSLQRGVFGEGVVDWGDEIYSVTWHGGVGYRWSLRGFRKLGSFHYAGEGWALTRDATHIILSDGTPVLRFLDPKTLKVVRRLRVTAEGKPVERLNELEYVKGEILANIWMTNRIARIDPATGAVKGWIDMSLLAAQIGSNDPDMVPNGIAYDAAHDRLFLTGKYWPLLFEVRLPGAR
jgi:glutaminyl-peptide cyclotransferase